MKEYIVQHKLTGAEDWWEDYYQGSKDKAVLHEGENLDEYRIVSIGEANTPEERRKELYMLLDKMDKEETMETVIRIFSVAVNSGSFNQDAFNRAFSTQHRTLQQAMFGKILKLIHFMASDDYYTDGRNEHSKKMAQELDAVIDGRGLPFI
jgi:hypothetical protein